MEFLTVIAIIVFVLRAIFLFIRWIVRSLSSLAATGQPLQPAAQAAPMPPASTYGSITPPPGQSGMPEITYSTAPAPIAMPAPKNRQAAPELKPSRERSRRERRPLAQPPAVPESSQGALPLLSTPSDLLRGIILQEVLGPPLSKRGGQGSLGPP